MKSLTNTLTIFWSKLNRRSLVASAALIATALGFAGTAQARDSLSVSIGIGVPGVLVGANYAYPVYSVPQPVYVQPRPVYVQPAPVYYQPVPVYYAAPEPIYYGPPHGWKHGHYKNKSKNKSKKHDKYGYDGQGYAPVYYQR